MPCIASLGHSIIFTSLIASKIETFFFNKNNLISLELNNQQDN
ncbi:hypothetical protein P278_04400 [Zhouia amylolytica AD3]|uniref:Uncharacterized protein n=1 Tax=Zhouia amylolytica AD3 TaxID=1286632 RepID=W2USM5_9FLAO|nr:hypothetical protein P278_04400 [Zhouia amylolytica AD3]